MRRFLASKESEVEQVQAQQQQMLAKQQTALNALLAQQAALIKDQESFIADQKELDLEENTIDSKVSLFLGGKTVDWDSLDAEDLQQPGLEHVRDGLGNVRERTAHLRPKANLTKAKEHAKRQKEQTQRGFNAAFNPSYETRTKILTAAGYAVSMLLTGLLFATFFRYGTYEFTANRKDDGFQYGLCECGDVMTDWRICFCGWFCPAVRWAETQGSSRVALGDFWQLLVLVALLQAFGPLSWSLTCIGLYVLAVVARHRMRTIYEMDEVMTPASLAEDICVYMWCPCCAIIQEARQVAYVPPRPGT